jgi:uncharacterized protein (DUF924 family)
MLAMLQSRPCDGGGNAMSDAQEILSFWFGPLAASPAEYQRKLQRWYVASPDLDREIAERFTGDVERALAGELDAWRGEPRACLALIVILDQFTRTLFRNKAQAFAGDRLAQELAIELFDRGADRELTTEERFMLIMPLMHAENPALQERAGQLFEELTAEMPPDYRPFYGTGNQQSRKYRDLIARFGRFPFRNEALGRPSTPEEIEFLRDWNERKHPAELRKPAVAESGQPLDSGKGEAMSENVYKASCFCGAVEMTVTGSPAAMGYCHCTSCRSWSASPINAFTLWKAGSMQVTKGAENIGTFSKSESTKRQFCKVCGGNLGTAHPGWGLEGVYASILKDFKFEPALHVNYAEKMVQVKDGLPKFKDAPTDFGGSGEMLPE